MNELKGGYKKPLFWSNAKREDSRAASRPAKTQLCVWSVTDGTNRSITHHHTNTHQIHLVSMATEHLLTHCIHRATLTVGISTWSLPLGGRGGAAVEEKYPNWPKC